MTHDTDTARFADQQNGGEASARASRKRGTATKDSILAAAEAVFSKNGYHGATTLDIAKHAKCYESLIFYHFGSKDKLFAAVLENAYRKLIAAEESLVVDLRDPQGALAEIVSFMWRYYQEHPELIFLLNTENLLKGKHLKRAAALEQFFPKATKVLSDVVDAGVKRGVFREDINISDLYIAVMGLSYFYLSNRFTLSAFFGKELMAGPERDRWGRTVVDTILSSVRKAPSSS